MSSEKTNTDDNVCSACGGSGYLEHDFGGADQCPCQITREEWDAYMTSQTAHRRPRSQETGL